jgi:hypothetical protein
VLAAAAALTTLIGCRIPGASFGTEPLQLRFAEATRQAVIAEEARSPTVPFRMPLRTTEAEPIVLAVHEAE